MMMADNQRRIISRLLHPALGLCCLGAVLLATLQHSAADSRHAGTTLTELGIGSSVAPPAALQKFSLYVGGLKAGTAVIETSLIGDRYRMVVRGGTAGIVRSFYDGDFEAEVQGQLLSIDPRPMIFRMTSLDNGRPRDVTMRYDNGVPSVEAVPAFDPKPWEISPETQTDAVDPLSAILSVLTGRSANSLCSRQVIVFDARRRFSVSLAEATLMPRGNTIACEGEYRRLSGFKEKMLRKPPFAFRVEFRRGADEIWRLHRALADTPIGTAVLVRKS